jgi:hypothetical protein
LNQNSLCDISQKAFDWALDVPRKEGKMENWKKILATILKKQKEDKREKEIKHSHEKLRVEKFYSTIVTPAFKELKSELKRHGRDVEVYTEDTEEM